MKNVQTYETNKQTGILLNANEKTKPLRNEILQEIQATIAELDLNRYPDASEAALLEAYGSFVGVKPDQLLAGNGSDQMLGYLIGTFLSKGKTLYTLDPDFSMYDYYASSYEATIKKYPVQLDGSFDLQDFIEQGQDADMVMFSNPNNPSGHFLEKDQIEKIVSSFQVPVVIDEAYIEFAGEPSALELLEKYDNLYITRTLSKAWGLAGLRVGFLISTSANMIPLKRTFVPYALNALSMSAAIVVLKHAEDMEKDVQEIIREREKMYTFLRECRKVVVQPSKGNFLYIRLYEKERLLYILQQMGIVIRDYAGTDAIRITIGTETENELVIKAFKLLEEQL